MRRLLVIAGCLLLAAGLLAACGKNQPERKSRDSSFQAPQPPRTRSANGDAAYGQTLFATWRCQDCHGADARGQIGGTLAATSLDFAAFTQAVRLTRPPKPAFSEAELSEADLRDIYAWVRSLPASDAAAAAVNLPEGQVLGMSVWTETGCNTCHGPFAQGGQDAPALANTGLTLDQFMAALREDSRIEGHSVSTISDEWAARLYLWLVAGAAAGGGC